MEEALQLLKNGEGRYRPEDFVIPARDHQGDTERGWFHMQPAVHRAMDLVLKEHAFPFRTEGDLIRWCLVRGLKVLEAMEPQPGFIGKAELVIQMCRLEEYNQTFNTQFEYLQRVVDQAVAIKMFGEARRLLALALVEMKKIPEDEWRNRCVNEMKERFGHLMNGHGTKGANIVGGEE